jgi:hypothetical protein
MYGITVGMHGNASKSNNDIEQGCIAMHPYGYDNVEKIISLSRCEWIYDLPQ